MTGSTVMGSTVMGSTVTGRLVPPLALALTLLGLGAPAPAAADDEVEVYARVVVDSTPLRSGPGSHYRRVGVALRGDTFEVRRRSTSGYWFQIERPDGTLAWVLGDAVYNHEVGEVDVGGSSIFAPPPLMDSIVEIAADFGALGGGGFMAVRPTFLLAPQLGLEITGAASVSRAGRLYLAGVGGVVNVFPRSPVVPFIVVGGGAAISDANADTFLLESGATGMVYGGGGLRFGFKQRITLRIEARAYAFFEPGRYSAQEEFSGGLSVFF
ncbi:MAG TPA: SH3 domain-containing protein [Polyangiaceae bacterium LLY-WYZ-15_(1-7)]|nr:SH3 domain-containing protein [Polyangiaceae bacterium LLY-WYZ-15_(1-7)]HJL03354.1 SH3 domain-containing protein [Polyangiaceae bacterium LLY-WYZ-15_(1-7)]HJL10627.1 SH3 domain-containing protein [Polyangiaceae bacterium LLY-WYZ-15_(1-7)]HJL24702.1 SH3 domain-containing protein [Polyangiaceae bacterium LLY-WYZ-15_(1-7)]HJL30202.1 SH3 domain-containing protein [Polyangiaceae bacterium LLY-WYZ-15_(1-7)]